MGRYGIEAIADLKLMPQNRFPCENDSGTHCGPPGTSEEKKRAIRSGFTQVHGAPYSEAFHMTANPGTKRFAVDCRTLPTNYPTHKHADKFWEALGRTVATFGFLEEMLGKAIFSFTATRQIPNDDWEVEFEKWLPTLEGALIDPLGSLIEAYAKSVRANSNATITDLDDLLKELREASAVRNVLCHGSWRTPPDDQGRSRPLFVNKKKEIFESFIDVVYLQQMQRHVVELACDVINSVTDMGWQFPGSAGPGIPIFPRQGSEAL
jgi:hypothetical protein